MERKLERILAAFQRTYRPLHLAGQRQKNEYRKHFMPVAGNQAGGEFDPSCVARLLWDVGFGPRDTFVDVGSGLGKHVVMAVALARAGRAWGVELSPARAAEAQRAADQLCSDGVISQAERGRVALLQGSCAEALPDEALLASHFLLALKVPPSRGPTEVERFVDRLAARPARAQARVLWSIGRKLPARKGLAYSRTFALGILSERNWKTDIAVHEYSLA